jgi:hypothetical protein
MHGPREAKRILNRYRKRMAKRGQKNGGYGRLDDLWLERLLSNSKRRYRRTDEEALAGKRRA